MGEGVGGREGGWKTDLRYHARFWILHKTQQECLLVFICNKSRKKVQKDNTKRICASAVITVQKGSYNWRTSNANSDVIHLFQASSCRIQQER